MQNSIPIPHSVGEAFWLVLAIILASACGGGGYKVAGLFLNRKRPGAEVSEIDARTAKTFAESRSIELQTNISAGDAVLRMIQQLTFTQLANDELHNTVDRKEAEIQAYERQLQWAKGVFKMKGLKWEDQ